MRSLLSWLGHAVLAMFGGIEWPMPCPVCRESKLAPGILRAHLRDDHPGEWPDWDART